MNRQGIDLAKLEADLLRQLRDLREGSTIQTRRGPWVRKGSEEWLRPMDLGAWNSSPHSYVLGKLVRKGQIERRTRGSTRSYVYRFRLSSEPQKVPQNSEPVPEECDCMDCAIAGEPTH